MKARLFHLEFGVASLAEVRTLVNIWGDLVGRIFDRTPFRVDSATKLGRYGAVEVMVGEEQEPGEDVFLVFLAHKAMFDQFLKALQDQGLRFTEEVDEDEEVIRCRLSPPQPKH